MRRINLLYLLLFAAVVCGVVYLSLPSERTLVEMSRDDDDDARTGQLLERRARREPDNVDALLELVEFHESKNDLDKAYSLLSDARRRFPGNGEIQRRLGMELLRRSETEQALAAVPDTLRTRDFYLLATDNYEKEGDLRRAEAMLLKAADGLPDDADTWMRIAHWRWDMYDSNAAAEALRRVLALKPDDAEALEFYFMNRVWELDAKETIRAAAGLEAIAPLDRMHLDALRDMQLSIRDLDGAAATIGKIAALPEATPADVIEYGDFLAQKADVAKSDAVFLNLAAKPGLPRDALKDVIERLNDSAIRYRNLDLALRLPGLTDDPKLAESASVTIVGVAMELGRFDEAAAYVKPLLANPDAGVEVLQTGLELAYRMDEFADMPSLHNRLAAAGVSIDTLATMMPEDDKPLPEWLAAAEKTKGRAYALAGWLKSAMRQNILAAESPGSAATTPPERLARTVDALLPLVDERAILIVAVAVNALSDLAETEPGDSSRQKRLEQAAALVGKTRDTALAGSAAFMIQAAGVSERLGQTEEAEAFWRLAAAASAEDPWSRLGLARAAARRGDEQTVEETIRHSEARGDAREPSEIRGLIDACLGLVDVYREERPADADRWLARAREIIAANEHVLSGDNVDNLVLKADVAERSGDAATMLSNWEAVAERDPKRVNAWLGVARGNIALERPDAAWAALEKARTLMGEVDGDLRTQMAWQMLAVADATPEDSPLRQERADAAVAYARESLTRTRDDNLAQTMFWRLLEQKKLDDAREYVGSGNEAAGLRAALSEAYLAEDNGRAAHAEALAALGSGDRGVLLRMAYVLLQAGDKERAREVLARVESMKGEETQDHLLQLADAYGTLEMYDRQYALMERRARRGGEKEWLDAVDRHMWAGDNAGAIALLGEAGKAYPRSIAVLDRTLTLLADNNRPGEVVATFNRTLDVIDGVEGKLSADALAALGVASDDLRSTPKARRFFRLSLEKDEDNKRGCMGYARLLRRDGNLGGAIRQLRRYVGAEKEDAWGWLELANTRTLADQNGRSEYREVVRLTEPDAKGEIARDVRAARAVALRALGREREALKLLRGTMGPKIDNPDIACDYAQMLMEIRQYDEAEGILRETVKVFPYHVWAYRLEATILVRRQKYDLAVKRLREALVWAPGDGEVQRDLGFAAQLWERTWGSQKGWLTAGGR